MLFVIALLASIVGQLGDLLFSSLKRMEKVKDYSKLIPGHGGILDRLDSFVVVFTLMYFIILGA
jgi:phosphatidate cytidylyltransferase